MAYLLSIKHLPLQLRTFVINFKPQEIQPSMPPYHRELLTAWSKYTPLLTRQINSESLPDLHQESLFCNPLITSNNTPLRFPHWISAGLTQIQDMCYLAIPGFLPALAIHKLIHANTNITPQSITRTRTELTQIPQGITISWKHLIPCHTAAVKTMPTLKFCLTNSSQQPPLGLDNQNTKTFYLDLLHTWPPKIPALDQWNYLTPKANFNNTTKLPKQTWRHPLEDCSLHLTDSALTL